MEFQIPKIVHEEVDEHRGVFVIEPLDRGFGYTFGNSLRRVLLSSLEGAAAKAVVTDATDLTASVSPWLQADHDNLTGKVLRLPDRVDIDTPVQEQLIVELYSK